MKLTRLIEGSQPFDRKVILYFQTKAVEYETGPNFNVETELLYGTPQKLEIRFPEHYDYDIDVFFIRENPSSDERTRIKAVIDDRNDDGGKLTYIMMQMTTGDLPLVVGVWVVDGVLGDGDSTKEFPSWHAAIDFFMTEVDARIKDLWATPGSHTSFE